MSRPEAIRNVRVLHQKKFRAERGCFLVQGRKLVAEALASSLRVLSVYATADAAEALADPRVMVLPDQDLARMGTFESGNEAVAVVGVPQRAMPSAPGPRELMLALDGVNDPGNLGTVLRVADWFGVRSVLLGGGSVDPFNPKSVQASMGAILRVAVFEVDLPHALRELAVKDVAIYLAEMNGRDVFDIALTTPAVIVLGSESHGISDAVRRLGGGSITIPRYGSSESLNVAMAASALCMEFTRRLRRP
jgi:TrmH family RNA methyltransferase